MGPSRPALFLAAPVEPAEGGGPGAVFLQSNDAAILDQAIVCIPVSVEMLFALLRSDQAVRGAVDVFARQHPVEPLNVPAPGFVVVAALPLNARDLFGSGDAVVDVDHLAKQDPLGGADQLLALVRQVQADVKARKAPYRHG